MVMKITVVLVVVEDSGLKRGYRSGDMELVIQKW